MDWKFKSDAPIYTQLIAQIKLCIASGQMVPGERLSPVRELAVEAGVNPNTMQRALSELEREGLVFSQRTAGRFVTEDREMITRVKRELAEEQLKSFLDSMALLGYSREGIISLIEQSQEENTNADT